MAAVPGITALECTLKVGETDYTMWITSASTSADRSVTRTPTWGGNAMVHQAAGEFTTEIAGLFNPGGGINTALETALAEATPIGLVVNYGAFVRTYTDYLVSAYSDEAPAEGPVTFSATISGPDIWTSVPAETP